jgi:hypothetical protein
MRPYQTIKKRNNPLAPPLLDRSFCWFPALGIQNSKDGKTFRPVLVWRALYVGTLIASLVAGIYYAKGMWESKLPPSLNDGLALVGLLALALICVVTWPPTVLATTEGLRWHRLLIRRFIPWDQIEAAYSAHAEGPMDEGAGYSLGLYIFVRGGKRYDLNDFIMGCAQLNALIKKKLTELRGPAAIVR